jgi:protein SCO1/2
MIRLVPSIRACALLLAVLASALVVCPAGAKPQPLSNAGGENVTPMELRDVDVVEHLGLPLPLDTTFKDTTGNTVHLGDFFDHKRPVAFVFAYHSCPMLCSLVLDAVTRGLGDVPWTVGKEFDVVSISIDPNDTPESATKKRDQIVAKYGRGTNPAAWHFLTGDEKNIRRVTDAVGFQYHYDERQKQYAHPAAMYLLTPDGRIARYLYGIEFKSSDIRLALLEASEGRSISTTEKLILYCYHYDPQGKKYSLVAINVMRIGGGLTALIFGTFLTVMWMRERRKRRAQSNDPTTHQRATLTRGPGHA